MGPGEENFFFFFFLWAGTVGSRRRPCLSYPAGRAGGTSSGRAAALVGKDSRSVSIILLMLGGHRRSTPPRIRAAEHRSAGSVGGSGRNCVAAGAVLEAPAGLTIFTASVGHITLSVTTSMQQKLMGLLTRITFFFMVDGGKGSPPDISLISALN